MLIDNCQTDQGQTFVNIHTALAVKEKHEASGATAGVGS